MIKKLFKKIQNIYIHKIYTNKKNINLSRGIIFNGMPYIKIHENSRLCIGSNVIINSKQNWAHVSCYSRSMFLLDSPSAQIEVGDETRIHCSCIRAYNSVIIGKRCLIASNCQIMDSSGHTLSFPIVEDRINDVNFERKFIVIEDDVWLCEGVVVLPGVRIGAGSVVSSRSVVHKSIPPMSLVAGNPAQIIRKY